MFSWLKRSKVRATPVTNEDVMEVLMRLQRRLDLQSEELEALKARQQRFEGRVSAWHKKDLASEASGAANGSTGPETKDQLRARLLPHGKRFKHDTN